MPHRRTHTHPCAGSLHGATCRKGPAALRKATDRLHRADPCPVFLGPPAEAAFQQHLRELGWVEGQNLTIEWRWAEGRLDRFATLVEEMVRLPVEVLVAPSQVTAHMAQQATTTISIVMVSTGSIGDTASSLAGTSRGLRASRQSCGRNGWNCSRRWSPG